MGRERGKGRAEVNGMLRRGNLGKGELKGGEKGEREGKGKM